jgi:hypothetical protein
MSMIAFLLCAAFVGGGVTACVFAYGQGWRAAERMWQSEWDERRPIGRETWVDAGSLGAHPVAATVESLATVSWTDAGWSRARARTPAVDPSTQPRHPRERFGLAVGRRAPGVELDPPARTERWFTATPKCKTFALRSRVVIRNSRAWRRLISSTWEEARG